ncbi:hypothetical protein FQN60_011932, partial [Etheostoma spectabile]
MYWRCINTMCWIEMKNTNTDMRCSTVEEKTRVEIVQQEQATASQMGTQVNLNQFGRFKVMIDMFRGVPATFQGFVNKMQHEKPMARLLHVEMVALVRELLSKFIKLEAIPLSARDIIK